MSLQPLKLQLIKLSPSNTAKNVWIPLEGAAQVFCNNEAVYKKVSCPASTLKRKNESNAYYHVTRQSVATGIMTVFKENTETNLADLLAKGSLSHKRRILLRSFIMVTDKVNSIPDDLQ